MTLKYFRRLHQRFTRYAISLALRKNAPQRIPRSGAAGARADYFSVVLSHAHEQNANMLVDCIDDSGVHGRRLQDDQFQLKDEIANADLASYRVNTMRYYGLFTLEYGSAMSLIVREWLRYPFFVFARNWVLQLLYNTHAPVRTDRLRILRDAVDKVHEDATQNSGIINGTAGLESAWSILLRRHGDRIIGHPLRNRRLAELKFSLDSLVESEDLEVIENLRYRAKPKALATIAEYEETTRRHRNEIRLQFWLVIFTFILAVFTVLQFLYSP